MLRRLRTVKDGFLLFFFFLFVEEVEVLSFCNAFSCALRVLMRLFRVSGLSLLVEEGEALRVGFLEALLGAGLYLLLLKA